MTVTDRPPGSVLAVSNPMASALEKYSAESIVRVIKAQICQDATPEEMWQFLARCEALGLDPFTGQLSFVKRRSSNGPAKVSHQIGIDGFRSIAERTGELVGISEPEYEGEVELGQGKKAPAVARVRILREIRGRDREFVGVARWEEFYPGDSMGFQWRKMPHHMLAKCAEAQAHRRAFPLQMAGLSTSEEAHGPEAVFASTVTQRGVVEAQYVDVTDESTGEIRQMRAGDEYVRLFGAEEAVQGRFPEPVPAAPAPKAQRSKATEPKSQPEPSQPDLHDLMIEFGRWHDRGVKVGVKAAEIADDATAETVAELLQELKADVLERESYATAGT